MSARLPLRLLASVTLLAAAALPAAASQAAAPPAAKPALAAHHPSTLLVGFSTDAAPATRAAAHSAVGAHLESTIAGGDVSVVSLPTGLTPSAAAALYRTLPGVEYAHPNWKMALTSTPDDTLYSNQWGLHNTGQSVAGSLVRGVNDVDIDAPEGWTAAFGAGNFPATGGTRVGVLDTGIDRTHADLLNKVKACATANTALGIITEGTCSDDNLHGTHVAGTIAANTDNGVGVSGVAPNAELAIFKALDAAGSGFYADVVAGIHWLHTTGAAPIISMSIGGPQDSALDRELSEAHNAGTLLIAAAGNDGDSTKNWPAFHPDVMSVSSVSADGTMSSFSTCNSDVEIAAPGEDIWSTFPANGYGVISGTSMATPHVSGVAAMIMSQKGLNNTQTRSLLKSSAQGNGGCNNSIVNLGSAMGGATTPPPPATPGAITGTVTSGGKTKTAIAGATVNCGSGGSATTASNGTYTISNVAPSTYTCTASAAGYASKSSSVTVSSGQTTTANYALR